MKLLLHVCCAPCSVSCIQQLRAEGVEPTAFWYNPNIHPFQEYKARRDTMRQYADDIGLRYVEHDFYGLRQFTAAVAAHSDQRCGYCYLSRMEETARHAAEHGFTHFSTTLLVSPYQDWDMIAAIGRKMGEQYGVEFVPYDFRPGFRQGQEEAREQGLYMHKYCGCIYSEEDRFSNRRKKELHKLHKQQGEAQRAAVSGCGC
jgi:predicted adenine nucleotide alpha hydrolase (AANH) superfamily ATPase